MSTETVPPPPYDADLYPALRYPVYTEKDLKGEDLVKVNALKDLLKKHEEENPGELKNRLLDALKAVDAEKTLNDLTNQIHAIKADFTNISIALGILDDKNYRKKKPDGSANGDVIEKFRLTWDAISKDFNDLIWESCEVATTAAGHAQRFRSNLVPILRDGKPSLDEKKAELDSYISDLDKSKQTAKTMSGKFAALPPRVSDVQTRVNIALKEVGDNFQVQITGLENEIKQLNEKILKYTNLAETALWYGLGGTLVMGAGVAMAAFAICPPVALIAVVGGAIVGLAGAITTIVAAVDAIAAENERDEKIKTLNSLKQQLSEFQAIETQLKRALENCDSLSQRIGAIGTIWAVIRTESQLILDDMEAAKKAATKWSFNRLTDKGGFTTPYAKLEELLINYSNKVHASDPSHK